MANDAVALGNSASQQGTWFDRYFLGSFWGSLGIYDDLTKQRGHPPTPFFADLEEDENYLSYTFGLELGIKHQNVQMSGFGFCTKVPPGTHIDNQGYFHQALMNQFGVGLTYKVVFNKLYFSVYPEMGYITKEEGVFVGDAEDKRPNLYSEKRKDEGPFWGLTIGYDLNKNMTLAAGYTHHAFQIKEDKYLLEIQRHFFSKSFTGVLHFGSFWLLKTDGRNDGYLYIGLGNTRTGWP